MTCLTEGTELKPKAVIVKLWTAVSIGCNCNARWHGRTVGKGKTASLMLHGEQGSDRTELAACKRVRDQTDRCWGSVGLPRILVRLQ